MPIVKNQHYVPQFYLRLFSADGNLIFAYDKVVKKPFRSSVADVASAKYFYDFPPNPSGSDDKQIVEKGLAEIEGGCATAFDQLLTEIARTGCFDLKVPERKVTFAYFIALQFCRTLQFRNMYSQMMESLATAINDKHDFARRYFAEKQEKVVVQSFDVNTTQLTPLEHADFMFNGPFIARVVPILLDHIWIVCDNQGAEPFYTSDSPVVIVPHSDQGPYGGAGFGSRGVQVVLPLSTRYTLTLWERTYFSAELLQYEGKVRPMIQQWIPIYNGYQVSSSARQVYCAADQFKMIPDLMEKFPELGNPTRTRFTIQSSGLSAHEPTAQRSRPTRR